MANRWHLIGYDNNESIAMNVIFETVSSESTIILLGINMEKITLFYQTLIGEEEVGNKTGVVLSNDEQIVLNLPFDDFVKIYKSLFPDKLKYSWELL